MPNLDAARRELEEALGADAVLSDPLALRLYARDASMVEGSAGLVVFPTSTDDVVACVRAAAAHDLDVVPRGSGTGLAGGATPIDDALVIVTTKMNRILEVDAEERLAWVEPGVLNLDLARGARGTWLHYAPDPSSQQACTIGGNVATNAGRTALPRVRRHVRPRARGRRRAPRRHGGAGRRSRARPAGYDLRGCFVGSEGTMGIATADRACGSRRSRRRSATLLLDFATIEDCAATVTGDHRRRDRARGARDDGPRDHPRGRGLRRRGLSARRRGRAARRGRRSAPRRRGASGRGRGGRRERTARARSGSRPTTPSARCCGRAASPRSARSRRSRPTTTSTTRSCPRTKLVDVLRGVYEIAARAAAHDDERVPRRRRQPAPADRRSTGASRACWSACSRPATRSSRRASPPGGVLSGEHGIGLEKRDFMPLVFTPDDLAPRRGSASAFDPDRADEPAEGVARRRAVRGLRGGGVGGGCLWRRRRGCRHAGGHVDLRSKGELATRCERRANAGRAFPSSVARPTRTRATRARSTSSSRPRLLDRVIAVRPRGDARGRGSGDADRRPSTHPRRRRTGVARRCDRRRHRRRDDRDRTVLAPPTADGPASATPSSRSSSSPAMAGSCGAARGP